MAKAKIAMVDRECVACGSCIRACPVGAISIYKGVSAKVDTSLCVGCGKCENRCPAGAIDMVMREGVVNV